MSRMTMHVLTKDEVRALTAAEAETLRERLLEGLPALLDRERAATDVVEKARMALKDAERGLAEARLAKGQHVAQLTAQRDRALAKLRSLTPSVVDRFVAWTWERETACRELAYPLPSAGAQNPQTPHDWQAHRECIETCQAIRADRDAYCQELRQARELATSLSLKGLAETAITDELARVQAELDSRSSEHGRLW